jgi:glycosyltransferase involved in cell wall biosynthesis
MKSLFKYALCSQADVIVTIDGDGQFLPNEIEKLCKPIISGVSDVVIGYRFDDDDREIPSYRKIGNKFLDQLSNVSSNVSLRDTQSGFRAYSKDAVKKITFSTNGFGADAEILINAAKNGLRISEEKVTVLYNVGSKTSTKNPIIHGTEVASSLIEQILIRNPFRYLGLPGIIFIILGIITSAYLITTFNETRYFSIPFTLLSSSFLIFGTMLLLFSGVLFSVNRAKKS